MASRALLKMRAEYVRRFKRLNRNGNEMNPHDKLVSEVAKAICKAQGDDWTREGPNGLMLAYGPIAEAAIATVAKALENVTPEMVDAWEKANWLPKGKTHRDFTDEEAARLCCAANLAAILGASPLMKGR